MCTDVNKTFKKDDMLVVFKVDCICPQYLWKYQNHHTVVIASCHLKTYLKLICLVNKTIRKQIIFEIKEPYTGCRDFTKFRKIPSLGEKKPVMQCGYFITVLFQTITKYSLLFSYNDSWRHHTTLFCSFFFSMDVKTFTSII